MSVEHAHLWRPVGSPYWRCDCGTWANLRNGKRSALSEPRSARREKNYQEYLNAEIARERENELRLKYDAATPRDDR